MNPHRLLVARKAKGMSQRQLGEALGNEDSEQARGRIYRYEKGVTSPTYEIARQIAHILDVPASYFYEDDDIFAERILNLYKNNYPNNELENSLISVLKDSEEKKKEYEAVLKQIKNAMASLKAL
ncbi:helix-turn-helix domain-containing protein [Xenorhabdus bovienii]|uniref:helix-turn-helix domain-containing protein n=1 Tax=Xenorhabdus bovienii TaxID=40576 RepID=UPI003DA4EA8F